MKRFLALAIVGGTAAFAQSAGPFSVPELHRSFYRLDDAVKALGGGDGTIVIAPGRYPDCAVITGGSITIRASTPSSAIFDGGACEGKATLVVRGSNATIDGLVFQDVRVADHNGAGIRLEHGDLTVERSTFRNSEQGILTADDAAGTVRVSHSTFSGLGGCPGGMCSHSIYVGGYGLLAIDHSRFERGTGGHYVKSRAARTTVTDSSFDDSAGRATNYMIDLPNGSTGTISGNEFVVGQDKENHSAMIAVAAEARVNPSAGLIIDGNKASRATGVAFSTVFVADWSHEPLKIGSNTLGSGIRMFETR